MEVTLKQAEEWLEEARKHTNNYGWIEHSIHVGNAASIIAEKLGLDSEKAKVLGYIHDIGKSVGEIRNHVMNGYYYLKEAGYDEEYANISLVHSYLNNDINCTAGGYSTDIPFRTEFIKNHPYTIYEKIICLCDLLCTSQGITILERRLIDVIMRKGIYDNTIYHIQNAIKLKKEIDDLLGYNLYDLFPNIDKG